MSESLPINPLLALAVARDTAREAGRLIQSYARGELQVHTKGGDARDLVTIADTTADEMIQYNLSKAFPEFRIFSEETYTPGDVIQTDVPTWLVDPLDGTSNFTYGLPHYAVSIALWWQGEPWVGVVYDVRRDMMFYATRGGGAWVNDRRLVVSERPLERAIICADWARAPQRRRAVAHAFADLVQVCHTARSFGSAALNFCYVAAGWLDAYFNLGLYPWDVGAGGLLVLEAGGMLTNEVGAPWTTAHRGAVATNGHIHPTILQTLARYLNDTTTP
nr:inositol monophosphatase family protein [Ardenticatena sp.]